jgi:hypothetical protein
MKGALNPKIFQELKKETEDNVELRQLLTDLLFEESSHTGTWWYKEFYRKTVKDYARKVSGHENK